MAIKPVSSSYPLYKLQREGCIKDFNERKKLGEKIDLRDCDFRQADLRGLGLSEARPEGASINDAKISGHAVPRRNHALTVARHKHALRRVRLM